MPLTGKQFTWAAVWNSAACNAGAGENYLRASSKLVSIVEACKQSCENAAACRSITFYSSGWCSHFSTECKERKTDSNAISIQLSKKSTKDRSATTTTTAPPATVAGSFIK